VDQYRQPGAHTGCGAARKTGKKSNIGRVAHKKQQKNGLSP